MGLVVFPILAELDDPGSYPFRAVCQVIVRFGVAHGIPTLDLLPAFLGRNPPDLWVPPANQHPNARGHEIAAAAILPFLRGLLAAQGEGAPRIPELRRAQLADRRRRSR